MGTNEGRYTDLKLVQWRKDIPHSLSSHVIIYETVWMSKSWFKENENLGDIIEEHRTMKSQVDELKTYSPQFTSSDNSLLVKRGSEYPDCVGYNLWNIEINEELLKTVKQQGVLIDMHEQTIKALKQKLVELDNAIITEKGGK